MADEQLQPQIHDLTRFLLSRLESYPEEFGVRRGRWEMIIQQANQFLPKEEKDFLNRTLKEHYLNVTLQEAVGMLLADQKTKTPPKQAGGATPTSKKELVDIWLATMNRELQANRDRIAGSILFGADKP